jgi:hypothetical protein
VAARLPADNATTAPLMKTVTLGGYVKLPANDMGTTMAALAHVGPLAVNVQANTWSSYESGIFPTSKCGQGKEGVAIDHVVQLVGSIAHAAPPPPPPPCYPAP